MVEGPKATGGISSAGFRLGRFDPVIEQKIQLGGIEPGDLRIEVQVQGSQTLQLDLEDLPVPASQLGQPIIGDHIGPALGIGHMVQPNRGDGRATEALGSLDAAVAGNNDVVGVDQDRIVEAEVADRGRDLADLLVGVDARVAGIGFQGFHILIANLQLEVRQLLRPRGLGRLPH